jgi:hypothetical protein
MQTQATLDRPGARTGAAEIIPLDRETRSALDTEAAAWHLGRQPQTLRVWACRENGPIRPLRVHGRLLWRTAEIRKLLGVAQ